MTSSRHFPEPKDQEFVLAQSARDARRLHGCALLDIRPWSSAPADHLPGSARLPVAGSELVVDELPSHLLPPPGRTLTVVAAEASIALAVAKELCQRGWAADYLAKPLPDSAFVAGASSAALWQPDGYVVRSIEHAQKAGSAVDFGCGNGRDLVYLAQHGWQVLGIDRLPDALVMAQHRAALYGVSIATECADARRLERAGRCFDLGLCIRYTELTLLESMHAWLRPGGLFLFHGYGRDAVQAPPRSMRARNRLSIAEAQERFASSQWDFMWQPQIEWTEGECWLVFLARRSAR